MIYRIPAQVGVVSDGAYSPAPDTPDVGVYIGDEDGNYLTVEFLLDLGIVGQVVQVSVDRRRFAAAIRSVSPVVHLAVGEVVIDIETGDKGVVREILDTDVYTVYFPGFGLVRKQGAYLLRPRTMEDGA